MAIFGSDSKQEDKTSWFTLGLLGLQLEPSKSILATVQIPYRALAMLIVSSKPCLAVGETRASSLG
jgi:hypothetical protein